ncbi:hypothetical protein GLOIN_2v1488089 [Rhizophagus irregularis DAOM 181602=DAOM 197198]|uniref:Uncharacterized protein n=3 Tax=Rhizophagus irregularis TaxID=588596 RepID=A0A2P4P142_RHIID|nr:hypothetical protein GLOIN_2v1488089 [Rhizophagus irregularis DAOM 181602=DAOM 197198]POG59101.1 hypothetical protein GLOIN_2v1488089 [Rhizophagus irregularis DAOM 181602=DAOM 197198]|eukprot:XP_025165967.1 hypothetical protein GLOIN_2v1488089 [Rhizophagus irregularis DAOM 181602=DAOM 197198]
MVTFVQQVNCVTVTDIILYVDYGEDTWSSLPPKEHLLIFCDVVVHIILLRSLPDILALADVMIMLSMRPAEVKNLCIENGHVTGFAKSPDDALFETQLLVDSEKPIATTSCLSRLRTELRNTGALSEIINATKNPNITALANRMQAEKPPADVMIMLSMRPAEVITLRIENVHVIGFAKSRGDSAPRSFLSMEKSETRAKELLTWIQKSIDSGILRDPGKPGVKWFNTYLKQYNIKPSDLRKIGLDHLSRVDGGRNDSHR